MKKKIYIYSLLYCLLDQLTKYIIDNNLIFNHNYSIINKFFYLTKIYNYGASWNILNNMCLLIIILSFVFLYFIIKYYPNFKKNKRNNIAFSLLIGGILGNLIDRIIHGYVIDYFHFYLFGYDYPIFNIADIGIVIGVILIIISIWKGEDKNGNSSK
jgi:signal peptidase II